MAEAQRGAKNERSKADVAVVNFKGVNVQAKRQAIQDDEFYWLENVMPVGNGNLRVCPGASSAALITLTETQVTFSISASIGGVDYLFAFTNVGSAYVITVSTWTAVKFAVAGTFSNSGVSAAPWKAERLIIGDPAKGYFSWDNQGGLITNGGVAYVNVTAGGTGYANSFAVTFTGGGGSGATGVATAASGIIYSITITNGGSGYTSVPTVVLTAGGGSSGAGTAYLMAGPSKVSAVATYSGRVWAAYNRSINYTNIGTPNSFFDFSTTEGGTFTISDSTLHNTITGLVSANNFLYIFGDDSVDVLGDVQVVSGATTFTRTNLTASIGCIYPNSMFPFYRSVMFAGAAGFYNLSGAVPDKISQNLDPLYAAIQFADGISGAQVSVNNILCAAFLFTFKDTFTTTQGTTRAMLALYFDKKWWFSTQIAGLTLIVGDTVNGVPVLYGWAGNTLYQLMNNSAGAISTRIQTKLFDNGAPTIDKQALKLGIGINYDQNTAQNITATIDNEHTSETVFTSISNSLVFQSNAGQDIIFQNNSGATITFVTGGYVLAIGDAEISGGKYLGITLSGTSYPYTISQFLINYAEGAPW